MGLSVESARLKSSALLPKQALRARLFYGKTLLCIGEHAAVVKIKGQNCILNSPNA
jgi:hypothetical protein